MTLIISAKIADWLTQLQSQLIEDLAENAISIFFLAKMAASKKWIELYDDAL